MKNFVLMAAALSAVAGMASASSFSLSRDASLDQLSIGVSVFGVGRTAGHIGLQYDTDPAPGTGGGQFASGSFATFCIELDQNAGGGVYKIANLEDAPDPVTGGANPNNPNAYGYAIAARIKIAVRAGIDAGWIASDLSLITSNDSTLDSRRMATIQAAIWEAIYDTGSFDRTTGDVITTTNALNGLWDQLNFNNSGQVAGLRAILAPGRQDQLYVVPLPPAAFAGLATLVGVAGVARLRRR